MGLFALDLKRLRVVCRNATIQKLFKSLTRNRPVRLHQSRFEQLEPRHLLAAVPIALDDNEYFTSSGTDLVIATSSSPGPLIANDVDIDSSTKNASVVANPSSGSLIAFNSNGTFTYRPNSGFTGIDSFTYKVNDGSLDSNVATVRIAVGTRLIARQNLDSNLLLGSTEGVVRDPTTGGLELTEQITPDQSLVYRSDSLARPIIVVETKLAPGVAVPSSISAQLTFNSVAGSSYSYSMTGITSGQAMRFALQADGTSLATGMYDYSLKVTTTISGVSSDQVFTGKQAIVNRSSSEFGSNWWLDGLDKLVDSSAGAILVAGNGDTLWFPKSGSTYSSASGDHLSQSLVKNGNNTYTLTSKYGDKKNFSTTGLLTSLVDTNSNTTSFAYADRNSDGIAAELISITDPFGRVTQIYYTSGKVSSVAHFAGQTTTLNITSNDLVGYTLTDPDGAGSLAAPSIGFAYSSQGAISSKTDAVSNTTSFSFDSTDRRLRSMTQPDSTVWQLTPIETIGLPTGSSGNTLKTPSDAQASITDERSNVWKLRTDRFGQVTEFVTALGYITTILRNANGLPYV